MGYSYNIVFKKYVYKDYYSNICTPDYYKVGIYEMFKRVGGDEVGMRH